MSPLSHMSQLQACFIGNGPDTDTSFESHGTGKHQGEICPHRQLFDYEAQLPGTQLFEEAKREGGISADELWLKINSRRRAAISTGNLDCPWVALMARILGFAPHSPVCGPYGWLLSYGPLNPDEKKARSFPPIQNERDPTSRDMYTDQETLTRMRTHAEELGLSRDHVRIGDIYPHKAGFPGLSECLDPCGSTQTESDFSCEDDPPSYSSSTTPKHDLSSRDYVQSEDSVKIRNKNADSQQWALATHQNSVDSFAVPLPYDKPLEAPGTRDRLLDAIIQEEIVDTSSGAAVDAMKLDMNKQQYCLYLYWEHLVARVKRRRSRLDEICEAHGKVVECGGLGSWYGSTGRQNVDESWGIEHPSLITLKWKGAIKHYFQ